MYLVYQDSFSDILKTLMVLFMFMSVILVTPVNILKDNCNCSYFIFLKQFHLFDEKKNLIF